MLISISLFGNHQIKGVNYYIMVLSFVDTDRTQRVNRHDLIQLWCDTASISCVCHVVNKEREVFGITLLECQWITSHIMFTLSLLCIPYFTRYDDIIIMNALNDDGVCLHIPSPN